MGAIQNDKNWIDSPSHFSTQRKISLTLCIYGNTGCQVSKKDIQN